MIPPDPCAPAPHDLRRAYRLLHTRFGHQHWWPAQTPFEVCVGAILTQNTSWTNVERALQNLRARNLLEPRRLFQLPEHDLAELLRPSGYFRVKARRLRAFLRVLVEEYDANLEHLWLGTPQQARNRLLQIHGIGPETADSILLYAGRLPFFVIDAYTRRVFTRHGWCSSNPTYAELQQICTIALSRNPPGRRLDFWQDFHAQFVMLGKHYCRASRPRCDQCPLKSLLPNPAVARDPIA